MMNVIDCYKSVVVAIQDGQSKATLDAVHVDGMRVVFGDDFWVRNELTCGLPELSEHTTSKELHERTVDVDVLSLGRQQLGVRQEILFQWRTVDVESEFEEKQGSEFLALMMERLSLYPICNGNP